MVAATAEGVAQSGHPRVVAVVLNWKRAPDTVECVRSLRAQSYPNLDIVVIDNGSGDDSVSHLRPRIGPAALICSESNLGFGGGCNLGIRHALQMGADYVCLVNNDAIVAPGALHHLVALAQADDGVGAVGAVIHDADEAQAVQCWGGGRINLWLGRSLPSRGPAPLDYLTGACLLLRTDALRDVGLFDDARYFMYWEDVDLCLRLRHAGWALAVSEEAQVLHQESASLGKRNPLLDRYFTTSLLRFLRQHAPLPHVSVAMALALRLGKRLVTGRWQGFVAVVRGWREA